MSQTGPTTSPASPGTRARRRRPSAVAGRHRPPLRIVSDVPCRSSELSPGELVADLAALVDSGLVTVVVDMVGDSRYAVVDDLFTGTGTPPIAISANGGAA